jgi:hypothetical protein
MVVFSTRAVGRGGRHVRDPPPPERLPDGRQLINVMANFVVHVRDHTATARLLNILTPDIQPVLTPGRSPSFRLTSEVR